MNPKTGMLVSPIATRLAAKAPDRLIVNGYDAIMAIIDDTTGGISVTDLTHVARAGFKGRGSSSWLTRNGLAIPAVPNLTVIDGSGCTVARLGQEDFLIIGTLDTHSEKPAQLVRAWQTEHDAGTRAIGFPTPKQHSHALIHLGGDRADALLSQLCAIDLRPQAFAHDALAQTMAAGIVATILRCVRGGIPGYLMLVDTSLALYFWDALVDAMASSYAQERNV